MPTITEVNVIVYENGVEKDLSVYDEHRLVSLIESVNALWQVPENSPFWFETDVWEERRCFKKPVTKMSVTCYKKDMFANGFKSKMEIPSKYRKKMFDQKHPIYPGKYGKFVWSKEMGVRFRIDK